MDNQRTAKNVRFMGVPEMTATMSVKIKSAKQYLQDAGEEDEDDKNEDEMASDFFNNLSSTEVEGKDGEAEDGASSFYAGESAFKDSDFGVVYEDTNDGNNDEPEDQLNQLEQDEEQQQQYVQPEENQPTIQIDEQEDQQGTGGSVSILDFFGSPGRKSSSDDDNDNQAYQMNQPSEQTQQTDQSQELSETAAWRAIASEVMDNKEESDDTDMGAYQMPASEPQDTRSTIFDNQTFEISQQECPEVSDLNPDPTEVMGNRLKSVVARPNDQFYAEYQLMEVLGAGAYGKALKAKRRGDGEMCVVKEVITANMSEKEKLETKNEVKVLAHLNHPNVVKYYNCFQDSGKMHIVMEYCEEGDLSKYIKERQGQSIPEPEVMLKFVQILLAIQHVHSKGILHRDLKTQNVFLASLGIIKLGDFGISKDVGGEADMAKTMVGTPYYLSPEICDDQPYGVKSDIWALGCILYEMCTLQHAFEAQSLPALIMKIQRCKYKPVSTQYSSQLRSLVREILVKNPDQRPGVDDILNLEFVRNHIKRYAAHVHFFIERRKGSFKRVLVGYGKEDEPRFGTAEGKLANLGDQPITSRPVRVGASEDVEDDDPLEKYHGMEGVSAPSAGATSGIPRRESSSSDIPIWMHDAGDLSTTMKAKSQDAVDRESSSTMESLNELGYQMHRQSRAGINNFELSGIPEELEDDEESAVQPRASRVSTRNRFDMEGRSRYMALNTEEQDLMERIQHFKSTIPGIANVKRKIVERREARRESYALAQRGESDDGAGQYLFRSVEVKKPKKKASAIDISDSDDDADPDTRLSTTDPKIKQMNASFLMLQMKEIMARPPTFVAQNPFAKGELDAFESTDTLDESLNPEMMEELRSECTAILGDQVYEDAINYIKGVGSQGMSPDDPGLLQIIGLKNKFLAYKMILQVSESEEYVTKG